MLVQANQSVGCLGCRGDGVMARVVRRTMSVERLEYDARMERATVKDRGWSSS